MSDSDQRRLLGAFVRAHRERVAPQIPGGRRRTPGLRREELAARAGISPTWCAWIEQGREVQASPHALSRLARALELTRAERAYLFDLAGRRVPEAAPPDPAEEAPAALRDLVGALACPAYGLDRLWNACCWNAPAERLFAAWLGGEERNLLRWVFLSPAARDLIPDWEDRARRLLAEFRADFSRRLGDPGVQALVSDIGDRSDVFARAWADQAVLEREGGDRAFNHPEDGRLRFVQHTFSPAERPDCKLVVLIPA